jgi:hypothetical protein
MPPERDAFSANLLDRLSELNAPTCDIDQMLAEIDFGRG